MLFRVVLLLSLSWSVWAQEASTAEAWLARMQEATQKSSYQGVLVFGLNKRWDSLAVKHAFLDGQEYEQLSLLTRAPQEMLRIGKQITCAHAPHEAPHAALKNPLQLTIPTTALPYKLLLGGQARIAGRTAQELLIQANDSDRYNMRLWLDSETALLLGIELIDAQNHILERAQYASIELNAALDKSAFHSQLPSHQQDEAPVVAEPVAPVSWQPSWLPVGFYSTFAKQQERSVRLMYSDGIASFSLYVDDAPEAVPTLRKQWGATTAILLQVQQGEERRRVTAVGELPAKTLEHIAVSVLPVTANIESAP